MPLVPQSTPFLTQPSLPDEQTACHTARFEAATRQSSTTVVTAHGDLDAANAQQFADFALRHTGQQLLLDLTGVEFFGTAGFSALHTLNVRCAGADIEWVLVPSPAVGRLLRICDPDATLPCAETVEAADAALRGGLLKLVAEPR